jgi:hypothetical protein
VNIYNRYVLTVALVLLLTTVLMVASGQNALDVFLTVYIIEALILTELYVHINHKTRRGLSYVSLLLFGSFAAVFSLQVIRILT